MRKEEREKLKQDPEKYAIHLEKEKQRRLKKKEQLEKLKEANPEEYQRIQDNKKKYRKEYYEEHKDIELTRSKEYNKTYREENRFLINLKQRENWANNTDDINKKRREKVASDPDYRDRKNKSNRKSRAKNINKVKTRSKNYYEENKEVIIKKTTEYKKLHPEVSRISTIKRRQRQKGVNDKSFNYKKATEIKEKFENKCFNCGKEEKLCLDHFYPLSMGFSLTEDNCILLCRSCNSSKSNKHPFDFFNIHQVDLLINSYKIKLNQITIRERNKV